MRAKLMLGFVFTMMVFIQGCGTLRGIKDGATAGAKEDWQALKKADGWMRENMW